MTDGSITEAFGTTNNAEQVHGSGNTTSVREGFLAALKGISESPRATELAQQLDRALAGYELDGVNLEIAHDQFGAIYFEINTAQFRMFFGLQPKYEDSGWGLAFHRSYKARAIAEGPLEPENYASILGLALTPRQWYSRSRLPASEASSPPITSTLRG